MPRFSERYGIKKLKATQLGSIDEELRIRLWNTAYSSVLQHHGNVTIRNQHHVPAARRVIERTWTDFLKRPMDVMRNFPNANEHIKAHVMSASWDAVYDWVEFFLDGLPPAITKPTAEAFNNVLEEENAGYRIINGQVAPITSPDEMGEVDQAINTGIPAVREHIETALESFSDRENPNYRNSIKESISAVESVCRLFGGSKTLAGALKVLKEKIALHPALEKGFSALYGYTSDEGGIRHALLEESSVDSADARFMLIACSAFVNFVVAKAAVAGAKIG